MDITQFQDHFGETGVARLLKGKSYRDMFIEKVEDHYIEWDHHTWLAGQPGVGKTWWVDFIAQKYSNTHFTAQYGGATSLFGLQTSIATLVYLTQIDKTSEDYGKSLCMHYDDWNSIFKNNSPYIDPFKIMLAKNTDRMEYNSSVGNQMSNLEDIEKEAIEYWKAQNPSRAGFVVPFNGKVKFIFTQNTKLADKQEFEGIKENSPQYDIINNKHAVRSRIGYGYENMTMDKDTYWGWIATVAWFEQEYCSGATLQQRYQMLNWLWDNWDLAPETSLRFVEDTLWKIMRKYPQEHEWRKRFELQKAGAK